MRRCVGCFQFKPQKELIRVVKTTEGVIDVQEPGAERIDGRGAYVCPNESCFMKATKTKGKKRSPMTFWLKVKLGETDLQKLKDLLL